MKAAPKMKADENLLLCSRVLTGEIFLVRLPELCFTPRLVLSFLLGFGQSPTQREILLLLRSVTHL